MENNIKSPSHYKIPGLGIESIDIIRHTVDNFSSVCEANVLKYILRYKKNGIEDLKKARVYLDWLIEEVGEHG